MNIWWPGKTLNANNFTFSTKYIALKIEADLITEMQHVSSLHVLYFTQNFIFSRPCHAHS